MADSILCATQEAQSRVSNGLKGANAMPSKRSLPWDLEQAMTAFQVKENWYEQYWLGDTGDVTGPQPHRRSDGSVDIDFYRGCAKRERDAAMKQAFFAMLAMLVRLFRFSKRTPYVIRSNSAPSATMNSVRFGS